jgi:hypothetical protein
MAFRKDLFLDIASGMNLLLYIFVMTRIAGSGEAQQRAFEQGNVESAASFLRERIGTGQIDPSSPQWRAIFSGEKPADIAAFEPEVTEGDLAVADEASRQLAQMSASDILFAHGYEVYDPREIGKGSVDFVAIAESDVLAIGVVCPALGEIVANDTRAGEDGIPAWFSGTRKYDSPAWHALRAAEAVRELISKTLPEDNGVEVIPVAIVPNGTIINYDDMVQVWADMGVRVAGLGADGLPDIFAVLPDKSGTAVRESYKHYVDTVMMYFDKQQTLKKAA